ncbi:MAG: hypothetical protein ACYDCS_04110 [Candidatus Dormibacteria bacterium]
MSDVGSQLYVERVARTEPEQLREECHRFAGFSQRCERCPGVSLILGGLPEAIGLAAKALDIRNEDVDAAGLSQIRGFPQFGGEVIRGVSRDRIFRNRVLPRYSAFRFCGQ